MSKAFFVEYSPEALHDLKAIYTYIAFHLRERSIAERQVGRIRREIQALKTMPERYSSVDWEPWDTIGMHKMAVGNYVVFYLVEQSQQVVKIVRIFYGGRDIRSIIAE